MNVGIIGYGSMGSMLLDKFSVGLPDNDYLVYNRTMAKIPVRPDRYKICTGAAELAGESDIIFVCVRPMDIGTVLTDIADCVSEDKVIVSLNGSVTFEQLEKLTCAGLAKVIPSVTAEIDRSQTLVSFGRGITEDDKGRLCGLLESIGRVIELPENELGMGSELVSCMPGFIAAVFDVICEAAGKHTSLSQAEISQMVLHTLTATGELMLDRDMNFDDVVKRVATPNGITEEGTKVIYEQLPRIADELFDKTLEKRRLTAEKVKL
ncbi:MAG: NAD(P)-binding domain-containing protein [Lachnospiraceae bacterium]|nr:NAD(P)-binding domain-containing protein [Lachnospiraceae bacterium]